MNNPTEINKSIIDGYLLLLDNLTPANKLDLISRLSNSIKSDIKEKEKSFQKSFGAFKSKESAEELIASIRSSRVSTREIESF